MVPRSTVETRLWIAAAVCAACGVALGFAVSGRPPGPFDVAAFALRGYALGPATALTTFGRGWGTAALSIAALAAAFALRRGVSAVAIIVGTQLVSQGGNTLLKLAFHRARPVEYFGYRERDLSFPSGHATTSLVLFAGLAVLAVYGLPRGAGIPVAVLLGATALGIMWSRLALGAHYLTDVTGGALLGAAWLCAALAVIHHVASIASIKRG